ncbi:MAG: glycosyltransferase family 39 protein [Candidatus Moraniibacteriota bacterium]
MKFKNQKIVNLTLLILIMLAAFTVRFYNIENVPSGVYPDEAVNGIDALGAASSGNYQWFYPANNGREGLMMNLISFCFQIFGVSIFALKLPSMIFGTLTVLGTYLLTKELFKSQRAGLLTAFFVAFSFWAINFSRISFRANMLPTILSFSFYYLFCGIRYNKVIHNLKTSTRRFYQSSAFKSYFCFAMAGLIFGIGLHTYISFRIAPAILLVSFIALWITKKHFWRDYWMHSLLFIAFMLVSMSPILLDFYKHPEYVSSRSGSISVLSPEVNHGHLVKELSRSLFLSLVKYNFWGDQNWRHNYPPYPILNPILGFTFLGGLIYLITKWFHLLILRFKHKIRDRKFYVYSFILAWFFGMLAPEFLTAEGLPHALRSIGTLPVTFIIATIPFLWLLGKKERYGHGFKLIILSLIVATLPFIAVFETLKYHYFWANSLQQAQSFEFSLIDDAYYLRSLPSATPVVVIAENMQRIPIKMFNYERNETIYIHQDELDNVLNTTQIKDDTLFILTGKQLWVAEKITAAYPQLTLIKIPGRSHFQNEIWAIYKNQ